MFLDHWGNQIILFPFRQSLWLLSKGPDGQVDFPYGSPGFNPTNPNHFDDDIILQIAPQKYTGSS